MKHLIPLLLLALLMPATAIGHDFEVDGIYYKINGNEASVTYRGTSPSQYSNEYTGEVTIPATVTYNDTTYPVTSIGGDAFDNCTGLTSVIIPNSVTSIGYTAFHGCIGLTNIIIPDSVTSIDAGAFYGCTGLISINIPNSVTSIGYATFFACTGLTNIYIPNSVISIDLYAFWGCTGLTNLHIPNSVTCIDVSTFSGCTGLISITVDNNNPKYDSRDNCNAIIETSSNTLLIGCMNTGIPNSVISIGDYALCGCIGLTNINIPSSITSIGDQAFIDCDVLDTVYSYISDPSLVSIGSRAFERYSNNYTTRILYVPYGTSGAYQAIDNWSQYFGNIIEMEPEPDEHNYLTINDITVRRGETVLIPVAMTNEASITSFQTDIFLPEGIELLQEDGEYLIDPSSRMTRTHSIISEVTGNGAIHVLCYSPSNKAFTGNSGEDLFYMTLKVADDAEGDYTIALRNTRLTTTDSEELLAPDAEANVKVRANEPGDVKEDGMINVADVSALIQYLLTGNSSLINLDNADVNGDGLVIVNDISALISMLLAPGR